MIHATFVATVVVRPRAMRQVDTHMAAAMNSRYPRVDAAARGWVELEFMVQANDLSEAASKAMVMARTVSDANPVSCRVEALVEEVVELDPLASRTGRHARPGERALRPHRPA